jgi:iron(II)-dependent oxidoreductase
VVGGEVALWVGDARARTIDVVSDLTDEQLRVPLLPILNPLVWEIGHVAWFQEKWALRHAFREPPGRHDGDALYDSAAVAHDARWELALPTRADTLAYLGSVRDRVLARLAGQPLDERALSFVLLSVFHEDMHSEALIYTRQTLGYAAPPLGVERPEEADAGALPGDVEVPGGTFRVGASRDEAHFVFDNEQWAHAVEIAPFAIARAPVTQGEFARFVEAGGYRDRSLWSDEGWAWREAARAEHPVYLSREAGAWRRRRFDRLVPLEPHRPVIHVNWHEAEAWCRWAGRRLPTEAEWEVAAAGEPTADGRALAPRKRRYPWGDEPPSPRHGNLDARALDTVDVAAFPCGDSAFGCRQMIGNVWEWTATTFAPYPGFEPGPYAEYSAPWFGTHKVLRGGAWATRGRLVHAAWRNYFTPERRDVLAGFRTCRADR